MHSQFRSYLLIALGVFLVPCAVFLFAVRSATAEYERLERTAALRAANAFRKVKSRALDDLNSSAAYLATRAAAAADDTTGQIDLATQKALPVRFYALLSPDGEVLAGGYYSGVTDDIDPLPQDIRAFFEADTILTTHGGESSRYSGLMVLAERSFFVASVPVDDAAADVSPTLVAGADFGSRVQKVIGAESGFQVDVRPWGAAELSKRFVQAKAALEGAGGVHLQGSADTGFAAYLQLVDIHGEPALIMALSRPTSIPTRAHRLANDAAFKILGVTVLLGLVVAAYLEVAVFHRLRALTRQLGLLDLSRDLFHADVSVRGRDEVGRVGNGVHQLLNRLKKSRVRSIRGEHSVLRLIDVCPVPVFLVDWDNGAIARLSPDAAAMLGMDSRREAVGREFGTFFRVRGRRLDLGRRFDTNDSGREKRILELESTLHRDGKTDDTQVHVTAVSMRLGEEAFVAAVVQPRRDIDAAYAPSSGSVAPDRGEG